MSSGEPRKLGLWMCIALVMGNMIGSGVFLLPASLAPFGWNAVAGWIVTIAGAMALALVFARLTRAMPEAGGPSGFVAAAFGDVPAFLVAWSYWVSIWTAVVTIAVAAVSYASSLFPAIAASAERPALLGIGLVWAITLLNLRGARAAGGFQVATTVLKLLPLIVVIGIAALVSLQGQATPPPWPSQGLSLDAVGASVALTLWALLGFESASVATGQARNPAVTVPRATLWGTALTGVVYLLVCSAISLLLPADVASTSPAPFATFLAIYWGPGPAALIAVFACVSCVGALNGWTLMQGEVPRAMAERGLLPHWLALTDGNGVPRRALLISSGVATLFVLMNASRGMQGLFEFLLLLSTSSTLWLYLACAAAALRIGVARPWALAGAAYALWALSSAEAPMGGTTVKISALSLALMVAGLPIYWWARQQRRPLTEA